MHPGLAALAEEATAPPGGGLFSKLVTYAKSMVVNRENVKLVVSKGMILARGAFSFRSFSKPENREVWLQRVRANFSFYRSLYAVLFLVVLVYYVLSSPTLLFGIFLVAGAWAYAFILKKPEDPIDVFGVELRSRQKLMALAPFSLLVVVFTGMINSFIWVFIVTVLLALPHASFHDVPELDALDALELEGLNSGVPSV